MNINFDIILTIQSNQCFSVVKKQKHLSTTPCAAIFIPHIELVNDICALNHFLKSILEEKEKEEFSFMINSDILNCTIKFIKKTDRFSGPLFLSYFFFSSDQVLNIFLCILCSINVQNLH